MKVSQKSKWRNVNCLFNMVGYYVQSQKVRNCLYGIFVTYVILISVTLDVQSYRTYNEANADAAFLSDVTYTWNDIKVERDWKFATPSGEILVYSAYYIEDNNFGGRNEVRVIGAVDSDGDKGKRIKELRVLCLYWLVDKADGKRLVNATNVYILPDHHNTRFRPVYITCPLPDISKPAIISITTRTYLRLPPFNHLPVVYNALYRPTRQFTMCLSPLHGILQKPSDLVQYFELNQLLGADHFIIYNYTLSSPMHNAILNFYAESGLAEIVPWNFPRHIKHPGGIWYYAQVAMLSDCMLRNRGVSDRVITTDLDEFIIPLKQSNWREMLEQEASSCEYSFKSVVFTADTTSGRGLRLGTQTRLIRKKDILQDKYRTKYIVDPKCVETPGIHFTMNISAPSNMATVWKVSTDNALIYHYNGRLATGDTMKDITMKKYKYELNKRVRQVLETLKLY